MAGREGAEPNDPGGEGIVSDNTTLVLEVLIIFSFGAFVFWLLARKDDD